MTTSPALGAIAALLVLTACGGDDDGGSAAVTQPAAVTTEAPTPTSAPAATGDEPAPTIAPELPEAFLPGVGPIAVSGDRLVELPAEGADPAVGRRAPVIVGETLTGDPVRIDAAVDGPTWLVFLAHWCPHCNDEIPVINELLADGRMPADLNVVGISTAANPDRPNWPPVEWLAERDWAFTGVLDGVDVDAGTFIAADAFGLTAFPFSVLVDGDGTVLARWAGGRSADELAELIAG